MAKIFNFSKKQIKKSGLALMILAYIIFFGIIAFWKYFNFGYDAMDLGIINNVFYNSSLGNFFVSSIHPPTYLGDHFSPVMFLLLPVYCLWRHPLNLVLMQIIALALGAWPVYLIAKNILGKNWGWFFALAWLFNPFVQNVLLFEFSFLPFATLMILWAFYFYQKNNFWLFLAFALAGLLVREDVALVIAVFSLLAVFERKKLRWLVWPAILSGIYFIAAIKISSLFSISGSYKFLIYYSWLGSSLNEMAFNLLTHPWLVLPRIFSPGSLILFLALLLPCAYMPLLKPRYLLLSALVFLQLITGVYWQWLGMTIYTQYSALLLPGIFIAWIFGAKELLDGNLKKIKAINFLLEEKLFLKMVVLSAVGYSCLAFGPLGFTAQYLLKNHQALRSETADYRRLLKEVPPEAPVVASYKFLAPLSSRADVYSFNYIFLNKQQFMLKDYRLPRNTKYLALDFNDLNVFSIQYGLNQAFKNDYERALGEWTDNLEGFGLIYVNQNGAIYQRKAEDRYKLVEFPETIQTAQNGIEISPGLDYLGYEKTDSYYRLYWQAKLPLSLNCQLRLSLERNDRIYFQKNYPLGYGLLNSLPAADKKNIQTNHWLEFTSRAPKGQYRLYLQVLENLAGRTEISPWRSTLTKTFKERLLGPKIDLGPVSL